MNSNDASIYCAGTWVRGRVAQCDGLIVAIEGAALSGRPLPPYIIPGFVDLHVHGGGGVDVMDGLTAIRKTAEFHAHHGTVALCATTVTAPVEHIAETLDAIAEAEKSPCSGEAAVVGAHIEGPFIHPDKLGGQPAYAIAPNLALIEDWVKRCSVRIMTIAPELEGAEAAIRLLAAHGVRAQVGHSLADDKILDKAKVWGITGFSHLFNTGEGIKARVPGVTGWALSRATWAELICDLTHVHPDLLRVAIKSIPKAYYITDCCAAGGQPDGFYHLGQNKVEKRGAFVCLCGTDKLAASVLVGDAALRNLVAIGTSLETAIEMTSARPSEYLGLQQYGEIAVGKTASILELDESLVLQSVWLRGERQVA